MTLKISRSWKGKNSSLRMIGLIPEVIPVRTKIPNPHGKAASQATQMRTSRTNRTPNKKANKSKTKTKMKTTMTVIFD